MLTKPNQKKSKLTDHNKFKKDMKSAGIEVVYYEGRYRWKGPAVYTSEEFDLNEIAGSTTVKLQHDNLGLRFVVYPRSRE